MPYDPEFIPGETVPLPTLGPTLADVAFANGVPIDHTRFSIIMHGTRGLAICTAHTIDGATLMPKGSIPRDKNFKLDPIAPRPIQTDNDKDTPDGTTRGTAATWSAADRCTGETATRP